jgi:hypothetical protein
VTRWKETAGGLLVPAGEDELDVDDVDEPIPGICIGCGCTDDDGCENGCWWADDTETICSNCE